MRPENKRTTDFLRKHGIEAKVKYIPTGSLKHTWRIYNPAIPWTVELAEKLEGLGFSGLHGPKFHRFIRDGKELSFEGNGGVLSIFARGHYEFLEGV
jgi:hypothetical protein